MPYPSPDQRKPDQPAGIYLPRIVGKEIKTMNRKSTCQLAAAEVTAQKAAARAKSPI